MLLQADGGPTITAHDLNLAKAAKLQRLFLVTTSITGTLTVPRSLVTANIDASQVTSLQAPQGAPDLSTLRVVNSSLSGQVPPWLLQAPFLQFLSLESNQLESMPPRWQAPRLQVLIMRNNSLQVTSFVLVSSC